MKLSDFSIKRPVTTVIMVLLVVLLGLISLNRIGIDLFPNITFPASVIFTSYEGVGSEEIETMITKPIESSIATVTNISNISSVSSAGSSMVIAEFNWGTDMDIVSMDMREKIDIIKGYLPDEADNPLIIQLDPSMMPVMQLGVSSEVDLVELKRILEDTFVPRLERIEGVAQVNLVGGKNREIIVTLDQTKMNNYKIDFSNVSNVLMMENLNLSGGSVSRGNTDLLVRVTGKFESIEEIKNILIPTETGNVFLEDIADITDTYKEVTSLSRLNGENSIGVTIQKQTDANTVTVSERINAEIEKIISEVDTELVVVPIMDQAEFIKTSISNVGGNAIIGGILAVLILFIFLKNFRSTIIIATAIPVSVIATFLLIYFADLTLNMMTLGGLALGVGMLVDNSIVVLENIYRYRSEGYNRLEASRQGSQEVRMAIVSSTLTTIVVFLPVVFMGGIAAEIFKELALTVSFSLLASLAVSLTLIPVMSSKILKLSNKEKKQLKKEGLLDRLRNIYKRSLKWTLAHRLFVIIISVVLFIISIALFPFIGAEFIPAMDQGQFSINVEMPLGTSLEETDRVTSEIEDIVLNISEVESVLANVGSSGDMMGTASDGSSLIVSLQKLSRRNRTTNEVIEQLRQEIRIPGVEISISGSDMVAIAGSPVSIRISGDSLDILEENALIIKDELSRIEGIREIEDSISEGRPELQVKVNRNLAAQFGLRPAQIGGAVRTAISGDVATRYEVAGQEIDIRVRLNKDDISTPEQLKNLLLPSPTGARVPLQRIADIQLATGAKEILRENQVRYVEITADLYNANLAQVMDVIQERLDKNLDLPNGYQLIYGGEYSEMQDAFLDLFYAVLLAIVLVYMVMASQFESLVHPFIVMFTVPMAVVGVMFGLFITGHNLSVISFIGMIMLSGIVVNNSIVLIDYINTLRNRGRSVQDALLEAGPVRLRPILMTTLTTILGLVPLSLGIGEGSEMQAPLAVVVIAGLTVSTFLTLYLLPVIYSIVVSIRRKIVGSKEIEVS